MTEIKFNATEMNDLSSNNDVFSYAGQSGEGITVTIGANVKKIPAYLFYPDSSYAPKITSVVFEEGSVCTSIGERAFYDCGGLTGELVIPDKVTEIGNYAFYGCSGLTSVTIGNSVTSIGNYAFEDCSGLTSIMVESENTVYHSAGNCLIETESKTLILGCQNSVIPTDGSVTSIGDYAFFECRGLTSIEIPDSVTSIGKYAFSYCYGLTSVTFENPNGWYVSTSSTATSGTNLRFTNTSTNATCLKSTYCDYYWKRK